MQLRKQTKLVSSTLEMRQECKTVKSVASDPCAMNARGAIVGLQFFQ